ncbi:hypothetical protein CVT24_007166 [Panaeolus cyanescens]|uniref:F-box domain-containing protein n=1 Tax=Panaeolus cyanescens TaxID=181874 RepID=A0A409YPJ6_9AGAR|nr:hypothetical protein CVT24_007166 [Panaeolus cyanescens]
MGLLTLPPELLLQILRCGPVGNKKEEKRFLGTCRLTCKVLSAITATIMFYSINLGSATDWDDQTGPWERARVFRNLLEVDPHLATHVKSLCIVTTNSDQCPQPFLMSSDLAIIIRKLQHINHFVLLVSSIKPKLLWSELTESLVEALEVMCNLPSIVSLQFNGIVDLPLFRLVQGSSNLEELNLNHVTLDLQGHRVSTARLKSLRLLNAHPPTSQDTELLSIAPLLKNLEQLHAHFYSPESVEQAQMIMKQAQKTLKELTVQMWYIMDEEYLNDMVSGFFKYSLPALESVAIDGYSSALFSSDISSRIVPRFLSQVVKSNVAVKHVSVCEVPPYNTVLQSNAVWLEIDRVLCQKYHTLEELTVRWSDDTFERDDPEQTHNAIKAVRSVLKGVLGILKVPIRLRIMAKGEYLESAEGDIVIMD